MTTVEQARKLLLVVAVLGIVAGIVLFAAHNEKYLDEIPSSDFAINRVAAQQMLDGDPLYDRAAAARLASESGTFDLAERDAATTAFLGTYSSFIGPPSTALVYIPWADVGYGTARTTFRIDELVFMLAAIGVAGLAVPRSNRVLAWLVGVASLLIFFPVISSVSLGQVDGWVMLALAVALWASTREPWATVGAALGVAVLLKISPWIVLGFMVVRVGRHWKRLLLGAGLAALALLVVSAVVGRRPEDFFTWINDVAPTLASGNRSVENQSLPALVNRLFTTSNEIVETTTALGALRFLGYAVGLGAIAGLWCWRRARSYEPLEMGTMILVALLCGPVSWDHYLTWAILPLMLLADPSRFAGSRARAAVLLLVLGGATALMALPVRFPTTAEVAGNWLYRPYSGAGTVAIVAYLGVALYFLGGSVPERAPATPLRAVAGVAP